VRSLLVVGVFASHFKMRLSGKLLAFLAALALSAAAPVSADGASEGSPAGRWGTLQFLGPDTLADVTAAVAPAVVNIDVSTGIDARTTTRGKSKSSTDSRDFDYFYRPHRTNPPGGPAKGTGSGVILKPDGIILTSNHVIAGADRITVTLSDGRSFSAEVLGRDTFSDLAVLKIETDNLPTAKFGSVDRLRPGDWVLAIGSPLGLDHTVTLGIISAIGREAKGLNTFGARSGAVRFIQTDAAINPGNSGGPLVNLRGEVVGINTFIHGSAQNIGFAIPCDLAVDVADKLTKFRSIPHPFVGIVMADLDDTTRHSEGLPEDASGVVVRTVMPRSPAFLAGVLPGDLIVEVDDRLVNHSSQVSEAVRNHEIGDHLRLKVKRAGADKLIRVQIEQLPEDTAAQ
jgi:S1-C subfamily serine protease